MEIRCNRYFGSIITDGRYVLDQLASEDNVWIWSGKGSFSNYIRRKYNLTPREYYNVVVFGDKDYVPTCLSCGKPVEFIKLSKGYRDYCSRQCVCGSEYTVTRRFLSYGYGISRLYIARVRDDDSIMKMGVTGVYDYTARQNYRGRYLYGHEYVVEGNPSLIVEIEQSVGKMFCHDGEFFYSHRLNEVKEAIFEMYNGRSTTIPEGSTLK